MAAKRIPFDQEAFVLDYVSGRMTLGGLAAKHGISPSLASKIVCGRRRPELAVMIEEALDATRRLSDKQLLRLQAAALQTLEKALKGRPTALSVAAAREVLKRTLPDKPPPHAPPPPPPPNLFEGRLLDLSPQTKRLVLKELGGPAYSDEDLTADSRPF